MKESKHFFKQHLQHLEPDARVTALGSISYYYCVCYSYTTVIWTQAVVTIDFVGWFLDDCVLYVVKHWDLAQPFNKMAAVSQLQFSVGVWLQYHLPHTQIEQVCELLTLTETTLMSGAAL